MTHESVALAVLITFVVAFVLSIIIQKKLDHRFFARFTYRTPEMEAQARSMSYSTTSYLIVNAIFWSIWPAMLVGAVLQHF